MWFRRRFFAPRCILERASPVGSSTLAVDRPEPGVLGAPSPIGFRDSPSPARCDFVGWIQKSAHT